MNPHDFARWVDAYRKAWISNKDADIRALFTDNAVYYTEPYAKPQSGIDAIVRGWLENKDEPDETTFEFEVIATDGDLGFVEGTTVYKEPLREYSNLWVIRLAPDGKAEGFTEWWMKEE